MVISLCCGKGGTGKTTSTCNIGAALAEHGKRVLLIDNDQQGSLTLSLGYEPSALPSTLANLMFQAIDMPELLNETIERTIQQASNNLHLIPANKKLAGILSRLVSMQNTRAMFPNDNDGIAPEKVLSTIVERLKTRYDYILIDCSPHLDLQMINALTASERVIIPTQAHFLDTAGLNDTIEIIHKGALWRADARFRAADRLFHQGRGTPGYRCQPAGVRSAEYGGDFLSRGCRGGHTAWLNQHLPTH